MTAAQPIEPISLHTGGDRRGEFRRLLIVSALAHVALVGALMFTPEGRVQVPKGVIAVELVSLPAAAAPTPAAPTPAPRAVPPPPPPKPQPEKIVLPAEPTTPKVVPKPKVVEKPKPKAKPRPAPPKPAPEQNYDDVLAQLRAQSGESRPAPVVRASPTAVPRAGPAGSPDGVAISPEVAAWLKRAKIHVRKNWVVPPGFRTQALEAQVEVDLDAGGQVRGTPKLTKRSGNPWYDEGVVRAIQKSSPLPRPPEAGKWPFVFVPEDSY